MCLTNCLVRHESLDEYVGGDPQIPAESIRGATEPDDELSRPVNRKVELAIEQTIVELRRAISSGYVMMVVATLDNWLGMYISSCAFGLTAAAY